MDTQAFYVYLDEVCVRLQESGLKAEARRIQHRLHEVAWTTSTELFHELETLLADLVCPANATKLPPELREEVIECLRLVAET